MEAVMLHAEERGFHVGAVATDNAGQCSSARRIVPLRWPRVVFLICFAHEVNNLVKAVLRTAFSQVTDRASSAVNALNSSSSKWLVRTSELMKSMYGRSRTLIPLCEVRWNSMQACFASLLRSRSALAVLAVQYRDDPSFSHAFTLLNDRQFWQSLVDAEKTVRPLCLASFKR